MVVAICRSWTWRSIDAVRRHCFCRGTPLVRCSRSALAICVGSLRARRGSRRNRSSCAKVHNRDGGSRSRSSTWSFLRRVYRWFRHRSPYRWGTHSRFRCSRAVPDAGSGDGSHLLLCPTSGNSCRRRRRSRFERSAETARSKSRNDRCFTGRGFVPLLSRCV